MTVKAYWPVLLLGQVYFGHDPSSPDVVSGAPTIPGEISGKAVLKLILEKVLLNSIFHNRY